MALKSSHQRMSNLMIGNHFFLLIGKHRIFLLVTCNNYLNTFFQICFCNYGTSTADCPKCCLINNICQLCTGCARCHTCNCMEIHIIRRFDFSCMNLQNCFTACKIRKLNRNTTVKTARTGKRRVKGFRTVGCCQNDNAVVALKAIHLCQQLVQCLLTFIIAANLTVTFFTNGINFINEYNTWCFFLRLLKKITNL